MPHHKQISLLLTKAAQDEYVLDKLMDDTQAPVEIFGFHAQQAAEKLLKAILAASGTTYPHTHRLVELIDLARSQGINLPDEFEELRYLTPFAVEFRYDVLPDEIEAPIDKSKVLELINNLRSWAESFIKERMGQEE